MYDDDHHAPAFIDLDSRNFFGMTAPKSPADTMEYLAGLKQRFGQSAVDVTVALIALSEDMDQLQEHFNNTLEQELAGMRSDDALFGKVQCDLNMLSVDVMTLQDTPDSVAFLLLQIKPDVFKRILDDSRLSQHRAALKAMALAVLKAMPKDEPLLNKLRNAGVSKQMLDQDAELCAKVCAAGAVALDILNTASAHAAIVEATEQRKGNDPNCVKVLDFKDNWEAATRHDLRGDEARDKSACEKIHAKMLLLCLAIVQHIDRDRSPHKIDFTRKAILTALRALFGSEESKTLGLEGCKTSHSVTDGTSYAIYYFVTRFMEGFCTQHEAYSTDERSSHFVFWRLKDQAEALAALEQAVAKAGQSAAAATTTTAMANAAQQAYNTAFAQPMCPGGEIDVTATKNAVDTHFGDKAFFRHELFNLMEWNNVQRIYFSRADPDNYDLHLVQLPNLSKLPGNSCFPSTLGAVITLCRKEEQHLVDLVANKDTTDEVMKGLSTMFKLHFLLSNINSRDIDDMITLVNKQQATPGGGVVHLLGLLFTRTQLLWADFRGEKKVQFPARDSNAVQKDSSSGSSSSGSSSKTTPAPRFEKNFINIKVTVDPVPDNKDAMGANWDNYVFTFECRGGDADGALSVRGEKYFWSSDHPFFNYFRCDACPEWLQLLLGDKRKNSFKSVNDMENQLTCVKVPAYVCTAKGNMYRDAVYEKQPVSVPGWSGDALEKLKQGLERCKTLLGRVAPDAAAKPSSAGVNNNNGANDDDENFVADANRRGAARAADSGVVVAAAAASAGVRREREEAEPVTAAAAAAAAKQLFE